MRIQPQGSLFVCAATLALVVSAPFYIPPAEDAAILFQYSDNLARTGVISYIAHGPRVEGATDWLWMILLACARWLHASPHIATGPLNALSLVGIAWIMAKAARVPFSPKVLMWTLLIFCLTPQMVAALSGFSVLPFGFLLLLTLVGYAHQKHRLLALAALLLCLVRPDGLVFALPLLCLDLARKKSWASILRDQIAIFYLPAILYMVWRVHYFHEWFPLPFLVKSQAQRWLGLVVVDSLKDISRYLSFGLLTIGLLWRWRVLKGATLAIALSAIALPSLFYVNMRLDQNLADRFFFYLLAVPAFLLCVHWRHLERWRLGKRSIAFTVLAVLFLWPYFFSMVHLCTDRSLTNTLIAMDMHQEHLEGTMALTEAGMLPYQTGWPAIDLWGLNTPQFTRHIIQPGEMAQLKVDLIVLRYPTCVVSATWPAPSKIRTWEHMVQNILRGVPADQYEGFMLPYNQSTLATAATHFTDDEQTHLCYFVRSAYSNRPSLERLILRYGGVKLD